MPCTSATFESVSINAKNQINTVNYTLNLKYLGKSRNVCVYQITDSPDFGILEGELFLNKTTNQITASILVDSSKSDDNSRTFILTKNGKNSWSGSYIQQRVLPVGECGAITKFSFVR